MMRYGIYAVLLDEAGYVIADRSGVSDMWSGMDSQETVGVSPELFHEFCFPYYRDLAAMYGLVYWAAVRRRTANSPT